MTPDLCPHSNKTGYQSKKSTNKMFIERNIHITHYNLHVSGLTALLYIYIFFTDF